MSIFEHRKPVATAKQRNLLATLRQTLKHLEAEPEQTPQIVDLKQILINRIAQMERESA